jgi:hypothetical protein
VAWIVAVSVVMLRSAPAAAPPGRRVDVG